MGSTQTKKRPGSSNSSVLIIKAVDDKPIGKQQQAFNALVTRIAKLQANLLKVNLRLDEKLDYCVKNIIPLQASLLQCKTETVRILYWHYNNQNALSKSQHRLLKGLIAEMLDEILAAGSDEPSEELKEIFEALEGQSYEEFKKEGFDEMKEMFGNMFKMNGFDFDLGDLDENATEEDVIRKTAEMREKFEKEAEEMEQQAKSRKKTKKQLAQEAKEQQLKEARRKNIGVIYKQLAKVFHPDLEQNPDLKQEKEELMKQLTIAYDKNDLHTLLSLELAFIHKEENNRAFMTDEKLKIYNEVLREQAFKLEGEIYRASENPKYYALHRLVDFPSHIKNLSIKGVEAEVLEDLNLAMFNFTHIKQPKPKGVAHLKKMLRDFKFQ